MRVEKTHIAIIIIIILTILSSIYFYNIFPSHIVSHWDENGKPNGTMDKFWALFLFPIISTVLFLILILIPKIDPLRHNIEKFKDSYNKLVLIIILFLSYIYTLTILWNLGFRFNMVQALIPGFAIIIYYLGITIQQAKRNWSIGIRTPWTISNEKVWNRTHKFASKLFRLAAIITFWGVIFPKYAIWFILIPILLATIISIIYSYIEYRKLR